MLRQIDTAQCLCSEYKREGYRKMLHIKFKYKDDYSNGKWNEQECYVSSLRECIKIYGLGDDCEYEIISVEKVEKER